MSPDWTIKEEASKWEVSVLIYPQVVKITDFVMAALAMAGSAFSDVQVTDGVWTCLWKEQRRELEVERVGEIVFADRTTNEGKDRQPLWGAEHRVGIRRLF
ncbi:MAG TPA: hypothetical protein VIT65_13835 [Microlunatus sp.]